MYVLMYALTYFIFPLICNFHQNYNDIEKHKSLILDSDYHWYNFLNHPLILTQLKCNPHVSTREKNYYEENEVLKDFTALNIKQKKDTLKHAIQKEIHCPNPEASKVQPDEHKWISTNTKIRGFLKQRNPDQQGLLDKS